MTFVTIRYCSIEIAATFCVKLIFVEKGYSEFLVCILEGRVGVRNKRTNKKKSALRCDINTHEHTHTPTHTHTSTCSTKVQSQAQTKRKQIDSNSNFVSRISFFFVSSLAGNFRIDG